jgi:hypothetical protein
MYKFLTDIYNWTTNQSNIYLKSLTLPILIGLAYKAIKYIYNNIQNYKAEKSLFPYYTRKSLNQAKKSFIRTKCQNIDPANETNYNNSFAFATREDLLTFFLSRVFKIKENETRFYLILADSGMGKTTFMLNLYLKYKSLFYINLHKKKLKLLPLGETFEKTVENIKKIDNPSKTIILLDGFDELPTENNESIMVKFDELMNHVKDFYIVLITCRTHFFSSEKEEPFELKIKKYETNGDRYHIIKKIYISPFDKRDIRKYINSTFVFYSLAAKRKALEIVKNTNDLMARPMLLSYIKDIVLFKNQQLKTNFDVYEALIHNWIEREAKKYPLEQRQEFKLNLFYFSYSMSEYIYENYEKSGIFIPLTIAVQVSNDFKINLNTIEIKSRSLLNRNSNGDYKFSHKSIYEFFLAYTGYTNRWVIDDNYFIKYKLDNYDVAKKFIEDIVSSKKHIFRLPTMNDKSELVNNELYQKILQIRNYNTRVKWISANCFIIEKIS